MVKEFQQFHIFLIALTLLAQKGISLVVAPLIGSVWSQRLAVAGLVIVLALVLYFANNIGMGFLRWRPLRSLLLAFRSAEDPAGRYCYAMIDTIENSTIGYMVIEIGFAGGEYHANAALHDCDHERIGQMTIGSITFLEKPTSRGYDRLLMTCSSTYDEEKGLPLSGTMELCLYERGGGTFLDGHVSYARVSCSLLLRGKQIQDTYSSASEEQEFIQQNIMRDLNSKLTTSSLEQYIRNHSVKYVDLSSTNDNVKVSCDSLAYANAWKAYLAGCEGHGLRNRLFSAISSYVETDPRIRDRTGDQRLTVLDLGCGNGIGGYVLSQKTTPVSEYIAVDCNQWLLDTITWHEGTPTKLRKMPLDLSKPESFMHLKKYAQEVDVVLVVRVLNHLDATQSTRLLEFVNKEYPDALLLAVNPTYRSSAVDPPGDASRVEELLASEPRDEAFNGVEYAHYPRTVKAYVETCNRLGYTEVNSTAISVSGLSNDVTHQLVSAGSEVAVDQPEESKPKKKKKRKK